MSICLLLSLLTVITENFPQLPDNYTDWSRREKYNPYWLTMPPDVSQELKPLEDTALIPFTISVPGLKLDQGKIDTVKGWVSYCAVPQYISIESDVYNGTIHIHWKPHRKDDITRQQLMSDIFMALNAVIDGRYAFDKAGISLIRGPNIIAFRQRAWWWWSCCDGWQDVIGAVSVYFIPSNKYDFLITCETSFYAYGPPHEYAEFPGDTAWEHTYPDQKDRIAELEQAVEQTFRVKE